jgi:hypothetical protein
LDTRNEKGTKVARSKPEDFEKTKMDYIERIEKCVNEHNILNDLILNWDQTGVNLIPGGDWTMDAKGSKQVKITGLNDRRQITALLTISKSGELLPPQIIYKGLNSVILSISFRNPGTFTIQKTTGVLLTLCCNI